MKPLSLYIHIPFCKRKCLYCDFPSFSGCEAEYGDYISALEKELGFCSEQLRDCRIDTVFIGGGTPTVLPVKMLGRIMDTVLERYNVSADAEITAEANPGTLNRQLLKEMKSMEINRLSMGVQAWQDRLLKSLGRIHSIKEFLQNYLEAREEGFQNINLDLMFSLPDQSLENWRETLEGAISLYPEHISAYSLIIEEGTPFYDMERKGLIREADEGLDREMYYMARELLEKNGYHQYELSNFAREGTESRHNKIYWQDEQYVGFGLGAHSYLGEERFHNTYDLKKYISAKGQTHLLREDREKLCIEEQYAEFMYPMIDFLKDLEKTSWIFTKSRLADFCQRVSYMNMKINWR